MASTLNAVYCAAVAAMFWTCVGLPIARQLMPSSLAFPMAPALGWAVHSAVGLLVFLPIGLTAASALLVNGLVLAAAVAALVMQKAVKGVDGPAVPVWAYAGAALLALVPALALLPKFGAEGVALAAPIFDHSKVALVDEMMRLGVPPGNPFFRDGGEPSRLAYYYLWHFDAAELALATGVSAWEADVGLTWFTTAAALAQMLGLAVWLSGRVSTALWVLLLSVAGSLRPVLGLVLGDSVHSLIKPATGFGSWFFQVAWVPQHIASASCAILAVVLMCRLAQQSRFLLVAVLVLVVVAGYESSTWVGGVTFALAALAVVIVLLEQIEPARKRLQFIACLAVAGILAACLAAPFLYDQFIATAMRRGGPPVAVRHYEVLGSILPEGLRRILDLPAYWLIFLVIEFPAVYLAGAIAVATTIASRKLAPEQHAIAVAFAALGTASFVVAWLLVSTIGYNNDLGWRAILPGAMVLTIFAAMGCSRWLARPAPVAAAAATAALLLALPDSVSITAEAVKGSSPFSKMFAETPSLWAAVRRHTGQEERVANNPMFLADMTPWPVNISWALLASRRSCFAGRELTLAYAALPRARREAIDAQFIRVFEGQASPDDLQDLATLYGCRVIVLTAADGAWSNDPFAGSPFYRLVESKAGQWRIYRVPSYAGMDGGARSAMSVAAPATAR